jgi:hypothetical protein
MASYFCSPLKQEHLFGFLFRHLWLRLWTRSLVAVPIFLVLHSSLEEWTLGRAILKAIDNSPLTATGLQGVFDLDQVPINAAWKKFREAGLFYQLSFYFTGRKTQEQVTELEQRVRELLHSVPHELEETEYGKEVFEVRECSANRTRVKWSEAYHWEYWIDLPDPEVFMPPELEFEGNFGDIDMDIDTPDVPRVSAEEVNRRRHRTEKTARARATWECRANDPYRKYNSPVDSKTLKPIDHKK